MSLYNPFKPHIVKVHGKYIARVRRLLWWSYIDPNTLYEWINMEHAMRYATHDTFEAANDFLENSKAKRVTS